MANESYKPGERLHYREEYGSFEVEVVRDLSNEQDIGYRLKVVKTISPAARGFRMEPGHEFDWTTARDPFKRGCFGASGGYLQGKISDSA